jgi:N-acetyl sugar amidotransferase
MSENLAFQNLKIIDPKNKVVFCKKCVLSNQRPRLKFNDEGICSACVFSEFKKNSIDWDKREKEMSELCDSHRSKDGSWDVIVPGSGGKDSSYAAYKLKKDFDMHPLTVTWAPSIPTEIGLQNFYNFIQSGFDNIQGSPNGEIHRKLSKITFTEFGDNFLPFIYGQLYFPYKIANQFNIPLIFFGEDGDVEYGGSIERYDQPIIDFDYSINTKFTKFTPESWTAFGFNKEDLKFYLPPNSDEIKSKKIQAHYFSYYENWSPEDHYEIAKKHCMFKPDPLPRSEGTYTNYASLDDKTDGFHYYLAFIKFGIGRTTSDAAHQIRDNIISRDEGVDLVQKYDDEFPSKYLSEFLEYMQIDEKTLNSIIDKFRKPLIWEKLGDNWQLRNQVSKI